MTNQNEPSLRAQKIRARTAIGLFCTALFSTYAAISYGVGQSEQRMQEEKARQTPERLEAVAKQTLADRGYTDVTYTSHRLALDRAYVNMTAKKDGVTYDIESSCNSKNCYKLSQEPLYSEPLAAAAEKLFKDQGYAVAEWRRMRLNHNASAARVDATVTKDGRTFDVTAGCQQGVCRVLSARTM